jgi:hypothetical protein
MNHKRIRVASVIVVRFFKKKEECVMKRTLAVLATVGVFFSCFGVTSARANPLVVFTENSSSDLTVTGTGFGTVTNTSSDVWTVDLLPGFTFFGPIRSGFWHDDLVSGTLNEFITVSSTRLTITSDVNDPHFISVAKNNGATFLNAVNIISPGTSLSVPYDFQFIDNGDIPPASPGGEVPPQQSPNPAPFSFSAPFWLG